MLTSRTFTALNAFYVLAVTALPAITVYDGPTPTADAPFDFLVIGVDDLTTEGLTIAVEGDSTWAELGQLGREENFFIRSTLVAWDGTTDVAGMRARCATNIGLLETALRTQAGVTLSGALGAPGWCGLAVTRITQVQTPQGAAVHVQLALACTTRI